MIRFFFKSYGPKKSWEKILCDVTDFTNAASYLGWSGLFVSSRLKEKLETMNLVEPYKFYKSKLRYKGDKIDYYIYHYLCSNDWKRSMHIIDFKRSIFYNDKNGKKIEVNNLEEFLIEKDKIEEVYGMGNFLQKKKIVLNQPVDFFYMGYLRYHLIASEHFKNEIETAGIVGFEFSELDYEVVVLED